MCVCVDALVALAVRRTLRRMHHTHQTRRQARNRRLSALVFVSGGWLPAAGAALVRDFAD